jgi:hypothetical protein
MQDSPITWGTIGPRYLLDICTFNNDMDILLSSITRHSIWTNPLEHFGQGSSHTFSLAESTHITTLNLLLGCISAWCNSHILLKLPAPQLNPCLQTEQAFGCFNTPLTLQNQNCWETSQQWFYYWKSTYPGI